MDITGQCAIRKTQTTGPIRREVWIHSKDPRNGGPVGSVFYLNIGENRELYPGFLRRIAPYGDVTVGCIAGE